MHRPDRQLTRAASVTRRRDRAGRFVILEGSVRDRQDGQLEVCRGGTRALPYAQLIDTGRRGREARESRHREAVGVGSRRRVRERARGAGREDRDTVVLGARGPRSLPAQRNADRVVRMQRDAVGRVRSRELEPMVSGRRAPVTLPAILARIAGRVDPERSARHGSIDHAVRRVRIGTCPITGSFEATPNRPVDDAHAVGCHPRNGPGEIRRRRWVGKVERYTRRNPRERFGDRRPVQLSVRTVSGRRRKDAGARVAAHADRGRQDGADPARQPFEPNVDDSDRCIGWRIRRY